MIKYKSDKDAFCGYISSEERFKKLDEVTAKLVAELINVDMDGEDGNVCKAIEDLINDSKEEGRIEGEVNAIYKLRRDGILNLDVAADRLGLSLEEYNKREERFFS